MAVATLRHVVGGVLLLVACVASTGTPNATPAATPAKVMVVYASRASRATSTEASSPRASLLFAAIDRRSDFPEEPSVELLPPREEDEQGHAAEFGRAKSVGARGGDGASSATPSTGYGYPKPQQDDPKPAAGYSYPKPQHDDPKPAAGYSYPKPQQDNPKPAAGYSYPKPQQDDLKPAAGYSYPKPQQDNPKPAAGYSYPKPQQDDLKPAAGYSYPKPQQDDLKPAAGYSYPKPQQDDPRPAIGYNYPKPQDTNLGSLTTQWYPNSDQPALSAESAWKPLSVDLDHLPPKEQLPLEDGAAGANINATTGASAHIEHGGHPVLQDELPSSYGPAGGTYLPPAPPPPPPVSPPVQRPLSEETAHSPPTHPVRRPQADEPSNAYIPPKQQQHAVVPVHNYIAPGRPTKQQDDAPWKSHYYYVPPPQQQQLHLPLGDDHTATTAAPVQQQQQQLPDDSYLPPRRPSSAPPTDTYGPPPQHDDTSYGPPSNQQLLGDGPSATATATTTPEPSVPDAHYLPPQEDDLLQDDAAEDAGNKAQPRHLSGALLRTAEGSVDEHGIRVTDMSCLRTATRARFTATITSPAFVAWPPVLEAVPGGGGGAAAGCRVIADPADPHHRFLVDLTNPDLARCGVKGCSAHGEARLCMRVLMPSLPGLRLASDPVLLLQCTLQPATGSVLQQARIAAAQPPREQCSESASLDRLTDGPYSRSARSAGVVHAGGERAPLHAHLQLFRKGAAGAFSRQMAPGGAALLGDELQLRAVVRRGDGWQSSRLADVVVRRGPDSVQLVSADGCPNHDMRAVCPRPPAWLSGEPLVSLLAMRVFMFRGMRDGDPLTLSARVIACLDRADCKLSEESCEATHNRVSRAKRSSSSWNATTSFEGSVDFVVQLQGARQGHVGDVNTRAPTFGPTFVPAAIMVVATIVVLPALALLFSCWYRAKNTSAQN